MPRRPTRVGALLAQQVAAELERNETLDAGHLEGTFDDSAANYAWTADVDSANAQGLTPVHIQVTWENGARHYALDAALRPRVLPSPPTADPATAPTADTGNTEGTGGTGGAGGTGGTGTGGGR